VNVTQFYKQFVDSKRSIVYIYEKDATGVPDSLFYLNRSIAMSFSFINQFINSYFKDNKNGINRLIDEKNPRCLVVVDLNLVPEFFPLLTAALLTKSDVLPMNQINLHILKDYDLIINLADSSQDCLSLDQFVNKNEELVNSGVVYLSIRSAFNNQRTTRLPHFFKSVYDYSETMFPYWEPEEKV
jgi:hypothetical protein